MLGTVWGIYHALMGIASAGQVTIDKISGPVGESLIMTAAGLMVAIPALMFWRFFRARVDAYLLDMELASERFLRHLIQVKG